MSGKKSRPLTVIVERTDGVKITVTGSSEEILAWIDAAKEKGLIPPLAAP